MTAPVPANLDFPHITSVPTCSHASVSILGFIDGKGTVGMDPDKVSAVCDWPRPGNRKQLQRFLGFANFYRHFIKNFSSIAAPLHTLIGVAEAAFMTLKKKFTSALVLTILDTKLQFIVEVDASEVGIGAVLSQRSPCNHQLHPCA